MEAIGLMRIGGFFNYRYHNPLFNIPTLNFSSFSYISCLKTLRAFDNIEFNSIHSLQGFESFTSYSGKTTKDIFAILLFEKSKPLCIDLCNLLLAYLFLRQSQCTQGIYKLSRKFQRPLFFRNEPIRIHFIFI